MSNPRHSLLTATKHENLIFLTHTYSLVYLLSQQTWAPQTATFIVSFDTVYLEKIGKKHINKTPSMEVNQCSALRQADQCVVGLLISDELNSFVFHCCLQNRCAPSLTKGLSFFLVSVFFPGSPPFLIWKWHVKGPSYRPRYTHVDEIKILQAGINSCISFRGYPGLLTERIKNQL